ncbi:type II secretion system protein GspD [Zunongwangia sp.]|uniref:type II secretion system protein GspD n=1 Tax=Zunongwangia sp. TaxID=1965325 RepID=UPI003AA7E3A1
MNITLVSYSQESGRIETIQKQLDQFGETYPTINEKVDINLSNTSLSNFLLAVAKVHDLNFNLSPELEQITLINNFSDVEIKNLLLFLAREYKLSYEFTGNIISIQQYTPVPKPIPEKQIKASYNANQHLLSLDLHNDRLDKVFKKITDVSGKNLVYAPGMESTPLSAYIQQANFDDALEKMAISNNLLMTKSEDGFYIFNNFSPSKVRGNHSAIEFTNNFYYQIIDTTHKVLQVNFKNIPISDIIHSIAEDLKIDYYLASPLEDLGTVSFKSNNIHFDQLLQYIFESTEIVPSANTNNLNTNFQNDIPAQNSQNSSSHYTYRKENNVYFFGTSSLLSLKEIKVIPMMYRSIQLLSDPTYKTSRTQNQDRNFSAANTTNYSDNTNYSNYQNNHNRNKTSDYREHESELSIDAIEKIIPEELLNNIDLKIDAELNSFVVTGQTVAINRFRDYIKYIDKPVPVILIEVMIIEVNRSATVETGINFGLGKKEIKTTGEAFPKTNMQIGSETVNKVIGGFDGFGSMNLGKVLPNFYMNIKAQESNGNLKVLSTPKLSTLNGHKAHLSSGQTTYYAVTNQNYFGSQIPQTSEFKNYYPIDAELAMDIRPFVSGNGEITLDINVLQSSFNGERIAEEAPPGMNSREFSSIIRMRDQDVAILGGIEQRTKNDSGTGVPLLARIPILKWLFSERQREDSKKKLNILIKPTVIY